MAARSIADTVISPGSFEAALHAAGGAVRMVELLLDGEAAYAFSAHRPPGHHATPTRAMGFCLFNNVAVAARFALERRGLERVMILDWDVHHGNGTNDIFHTSDRVLFVSIHQSPLYPGTGPAGDVGAGPGEGFTVNLPVPPGTGDAVYLSLVEHVAVPLLEAFEPRAGAGLGGLRRAPRRSARGVPGERAGIRGDDARGPARGGLGRGAARVRARGRLRARRAGALGRGDDDAS